MNMNTTAVSELSAMPFPLPVGLGGSGTFEGMASPKKKYPSHAPRTADLRRLGYRLTNPTALRDRLLDAYRMSGEPSMRAFSAKAGLEQTVFQAIVKSFDDAKVRGPSMERLEAIAAAAGTTVAKLLADQQYPLPPEVLDPKKAPASATSTAKGPGPAAREPKATTGTHAVQPAVESPRVQLPREDAPLPQRPVVGQIPGIEQAIAEARKLGVKFRSQISEETWRAIPLVAPSLSAAGLLGPDPEAILKLAAFLEDERLGKNV